MATNIGELVWKITGNTTDIDKSLTQTNTKLGKFGKAAAAAFTVAGVAAFAAAVVKVGKEMFNLALKAGDLAESQNAVNVVFGDGADIITEFGEDSVYSVGLTQTAFNELATTIGAQLGQAGLDVDTMANKTLELTQRAADTASIFNVEASEALEAFGSALRGEAEPARRFGVNISDAAVQAEALASGLVESKNEITDQIKVQARYNIIMQQSAGYAGDFANTQDSLNNQTKIARANMDELAAAMGERLAPATTKAVTAFNDLLTSMIDTFERGTAIKDAYQALEDGTATLEQQLLVLQTRQERFTAASRSQRAELERQISTLENAIERRDNYLIMQGLLKDAAEEEAEATAESTEAIEENTEAIEDNTEAADANMARILARYDAEDAAQEKLEEQLRNEYYFKQGLAELELERAAEAEQAHEDKIARIQAELSAYSDYASSVGTIFSNLITAQMAGDDELTESQKRNIIALYRIQQAANIAQVTIDTAAAIARQYKDLPLYAAIPASIIAGAAGAAQIAVIAATDPPVELATGGVIPASPGGTSAIIGEGGVDEAVIPLDEAGIGGTMSLTVNIGQKAIIGPVQVALDNRQIVVNAT